MHQWTVHCIHLPFDFVELRQCSLHQESSTSHHHCTTTMTTNSASGMSSSLTNQIEDEQILDLQSRLQFSHNIQVRRGTNEMIPEHQIRFISSLWHWRVEIVTLSSLVCFSCKQKTRAHLRYVSNSLTGADNGHATSSLTLTQTWAILLNDMLLFTQRNVMDTRLTLVCEAISLNDIVDFRSSADRKWHSIALDEWLIIISSRSRCIDLRFEQAD